MQSTPYTCWEVTHVDEQEEPDVRGCHVSQERNSMPSHHNLLPHLFPQ